jgi:glycosyltransferase involved in cell wall biosynthesis
MHETDVHLLGRLDRTSIDRAYREASHVIVPSTVIENLPTVILESFSRGTPVIAAASGGIPEIVTEAAAGWLFPPCGDDGLKKALDEASRLEGWRAMSDRAREFARGLTLERHLDELEQLYRSLITVG